MLFDQKMFNPENKKNNRENTLQGEHLHRVGGGYCILLAYR